MLAGVREANALTARWLSTVDDSTTVVSGTVVWPLLAALAVGAEGRARDELRAAVGDHLADPLAVACELCRTLDAATAVRVAAGLWAHEQLPLERRWLDRLPPGTFGALSGNGDHDRSRLDAWVREHTDNQLERMPIQLGSGVLLVLAAALSVRTRWKLPFHDCPLTGSGPWRRRDALAGLSRTDDDLDVLRVAGTGRDQLTLVTVAGEDDVDVHLVLGHPKRRAAQVLPAAIAVIQGDLASVPGSALKIGAKAPGVSVTKTRSFTPEPFLNVTTARFTVRAAHNLLDLPQVFGLGAATDNSQGHFPGISKVPLAVSEAREDVVATFSAVGFEAAAVAAIGLAPAGAPPRPEHAIRVIQVTFDRPFGFVATHRPTGLVLVAGWVADPEEYTAPSGGGRPW